jgi:ubiquinone biosynthesis protein COQ9
LGDTSDDVNWYSKRAILSGVYGATLLFWLGDDSPDQSATWAFLDRRIDNVMQFEKFKSMANTNPLLKAMMAGPNMVLSRLRAPKSASRADMPGFWSGKTNGSAERWQE